MMFENSKEELLHDLNQSILNSNKSYETIAFICIGTDRCTGDSYGPMVGSMLKGLQSNQIKVYGTLHEPIHANNLSETLNSINLENALVVAIDACLGNSVGEIIIQNKSIKPGAAVGKSLPQVGDISIMGVVNQNSSMEFIVLQNTRLSFVYDLAKATFEVIKDFIESNMDIKEIEVRRRSNQ
jgi:putative sporulation protein YyaC